MFYHFDRTRAAGQSQMKIILIERPAALSAKRRIAELRSGLSERGLHPSAANR
jgi:hypothetical protein